MIPAILSCLFVLYLYRTLNEPATVEHPTSAVQASSSAESMSQRLQELQARLDRLADSAAETPKDLS